MGKALRPVSKKGVEGKRPKFVRSIVREVAGFAPYERRVMELLKVSKDKRCPAPLQEAPWYPPPGQAQEGGDGQRPAVAAQGAGVSKLWRCTDPTNFFLK